MFEGSIESPTETYDATGNIHMVSANKENQAPVPEKVILTQQSKQMQYQQTGATVGFSGQRRCLYNTAPLRQQWLLQVYLVTRLSVKELDSDL